MPHLAARRQTLTLPTGGALRILAADGEPLLDVISTNDGPVLRFAHQTPGLDFAGKLRIEADAIEMIARDGEMKMLAKDDVVVRGETIRLN